MDKAEELLRHEPGVTVKEVAARLGFVDDFYFSRAFRQRKGLPPSKCLVRQ
jgi:AraC-like DNA-binding protein